ncbi:O-antigen ligase family protein [Modestobacter altitudinis]|uniref:O-antigen ligase family protein n=1 Tax=Modestobacter altitudinis TaxID=2213158 RepID=UPI00110CC62D|nr:O-antigen ligase family protein [Modestobacter altitudinis]
MSTTEAVGLTRAAGRVERSAALLLASAFVLSQWSEFVVARWMVRALPIWVVLIVLALPQARRARLRLSVPLAAFVLWCLVSATWSADPTTTSRRLIDLVALTAVGWVAGQICGASVAASLARTVRYVLVATVVTLLVAPGWATAAGVDGAPGWHGLFPHKNDLGFFCALAAVTLWTQLPRGWRRRAWLVLTLVLLLGSASASALGATVAAMVVVLWSQARDRRAAGARLMVDVTAAAGAGVLTAVALVLPDLFLGLLGRDSSLTGRRAIWTAVLDQVQHRPLTGHGFGGVWELTSPVTLAIWRESRFDAFYAHNGWLDIRLQVGWVGLVLLVVVLAAIAVGAVRGGGAVGAWALGVLVLLLLTSITESSPFTGNGLLLIALLAGCLGRPAMRPATGPGTAHPALVDERREVVTA